MNDLGLKMCPFCGCRDVYAYKKESCSYIQVRCPDCAIDGPKVNSIWFDTMQEAIREAKKLWNTRHIPVYRDDIIFDEMKDTK